MLRRHRSAPGEAWAGTSGLEENVKIRAAAKLRTERGQAEIEGAKNVQHRRVRIEQRLHVDEVDGPADIDQDSLA